MSVSDPLIKDIKGCVLRLHEDSSNAPIEDSNVLLLKLCQIFEKICTKGSKCERLCFYGRKKQPPFEWFFKIPMLDNYSYENSVESVKKCKNVRTALGKFRLLVRHCLVKKCLHFPVGILGDSRSRGIYYHSNSILGDEILSSILYSVLLQVNRINFSLNLENTSFLDESWLLPDFVRLELVPCSSLGIAVSFSNDKAVIVEVKPNSVASETEEINVGDILDNLNGVSITTSKKGSLNSIVNKQKGPVNVTILKSYHKQTKNLYPPVKKLLKELQLEERVEKNQLFPHVGQSSQSKSDVSFNNNGGYEAAFLAEIELEGDRGSTREIEETIRKFVQKTPKHLQNKTDVRMEINELTVKIVKNDNDQVMFEHNFMEISSCGSTPLLANYLAYIVGKSPLENKSSKDRFVCYIFHVKSTDVADKILKSIGHGFYRTHFAV